MSALTVWLLVGIVSVGLAGILAELFARWWIRRRQVYRVWVPRHRRIIRPDREAFPAAEAVVQFQTNSIGQRGDEPPDGSEPVYRVLVAGGSAAECMFLDQWTAWPGALERLLDRPESRRALGISRVHVGSIGKSEVDSQALALALRRVLPGFPRLQAIIVLVGASNVLRWLSTGARAGALPPPLPEGELFDWHPNGPFSFHPKRTALAELARRLRTRLRATEERRHAGRFMTRTRAMRRQAMPLETTVPDPAAVLDAFESSLRAALVTAMRYSDRVIVARQPWLDKPRFTDDEESQFWHGALGDVFAAEVKRFCSAHLIAQLMSQVDARAAAVAEELGLEHIDLREAVDSSLANYYDQFHFTPAGSARVAEAVAALLLRPAERAEREALAATEGADRD